MSDSGTTMDTEPPRARRHTELRRAALGLFVSVWLAALCPPASAAPLQAKYLYTLSNFGGAVPYTGGRVHVDSERNEVYVLYQNVIRIFNPSGMEVFSFGDDFDLGQILDAVVDDRGDVLLLSNKDSHTLVTRCDFRGVPIGRLEITNLPDGVTFAADRMVLRNGQLYFVSLTASRIIITDANGAFRDQIEVLPLLDAEDKQKSGAELMGFTVDADGNMFFTVPVLFRVFRLSPDRKLTSFGRPGSAPGRFGVAAGIVSDSRGNLLVADKLRCVVMIFDKDFNFITEFGHRGFRPENLIVPDEVAIDGRDRLYVSQGRKRGISVFALASE